MPSSRLRIDIARILKDEGYIANFKVVEEEKKKVLRVLLRYGPGGESTISSMERVSKPGRRVYVGTREITRVLGGLGVTILTTPKGVMTGKNARKAGVGGEILCSVS
jgi:small subunit ribosomal protein S8